MHTYEVRRLLNVVDGDTVDCELSLGFGLRACLRLRLAGIDCPELYGPTASQAGRDAAAFTSRWLAEHFADGLTVHTYKGADSAVGIGDGAFGRWLARFIAADGSSLADALLAAGHAVQADA